MIFFLDAAMGFWPTECCSSRIKLSFSDSTSCIMSCRTIMLACQRRCLQLLQYVRKGTNASVFRLTARMLGSSPVLLSGSLHRSKYFDIAWRMASMPAVVLLAPSSPKKREVSLIFISRLGVISQSSCPHQQKNKLVVILPAQGGWRSIL